MTWCVVGSGAESEFAEQRMHADQAVLVARNQIQLSAILQSKADT
jgi:hypothetical protein